MIKFENTEVMNFEGALRGMRNPLNSWDKSDSEWDWVEDPSPINPNDPGMMYIIGPNDLDLARRLISAGSDHRKFLRQIFVSVDITAPLYWWKEFDTYKVATVANSCSTMHTIHKKEFTLEDFSHEHLFNGLEENATEMDYYENPVGALEYIIAVLNDYRKRFLETKDKKAWWQMIQLLPTSYNQKRTVTFNYETLRNISHSRRNHKLDEWSVGFMEWIDGLPYAEELIKN